MATILRHEATSQTLRAGRAWKNENGIQHPSNWNIWSAAEKAAAGITEIVQESPPDSRLYRWSQNADGTINSTAKDLADSGSGDSLVLGVKSQLKQAVDSQQGSLLDQTDWYIIRQVDTAIARPIPSDVQTWRDAIRTKGDAMVSAIDGAANTDAVAALFVVYDRDGVLESGILYDWPELGT